MSWPAGVAPPAEPDDLVDLLSFGAAAQPTADARPGGRLCVSARTITSRAYIHIRRHRGGGDTIVPCPQGLVPAIHLRETMGHIPRDTGQVNSWLMAPMYRNATTKTTMRHVIDDRYITTKSDTCAMAGYDLFLLTYAWFPYYLCSQKISCKRCQRLIYRYKHHFGHTYTSFSGSGRHSVAPVSFYP